MTRLLRYAVRGALAFAILGFVPIALVPFSAPKAAGMRATGLCLLVVVLVDALICRLWRRPPLSPSSPKDRRPRELRVALAMDLAVAIWVSVALLSTAASVSPRLSLLGEIQQREGLMTTLALAGCYAATRHSHRCQAHARRTLQVFVGSAAVAAAYALVQFAGWDPIHWSRVVMYSAGASSVPRPFATLGTPIMLGALLAPALGITLVRMGCGSGPFLGLAALAALLATALMSTLSRGAWFAAGVAIIAAFAGSWLLGGPRVARRAALTFLAAAIPTVIWCLAAIRGPLLARISEVAQADATSGPARLEIARAAFSLWRAHPWLGGGPDTFGLLFTRVQTAAYWANEWQSLPGHAHSAALQLLSTGGSLAAVAALTWIVVVVVALISAWNSPGRSRNEVLEIVVALAAIGAAGAVNQVGIACAVLIALLSALLVRWDGPLQPTCEAPAAMRRLAYFAALALAVPLMHSTLTEMRALAAAGRARGALEQATFPEGDRLPLSSWAARQATQAAFLAPREDELWRLCCDAHLAYAREAIRVRDPASASTAVLAAEAASYRALQLEPHRAANLQRLGNSLALRAQLELDAPPSGRFAEPIQPNAEVNANRVDSVFAEAGRYAPFDALILVDRTRAQLELHRGEQALLTSHRIASMYPGSSTGYALEGAAYLMLGSYPSAHHALQKALGAKWEDGSEAAHQAARDYVRAIEAGEQPSTCW